MANTTNFAALEEDVNSSHAIMVRCDSRSDPDGNPGRITVLNQPRLALVDTLGEVVFLDEVSVMEFIRTSDGPHEVWARTCDGSLARFTRSGN